MYEYGYNLQAASPLRASSYGPCLLPYEGGGMAAGPRLGSTEPREKTGLRLSLTLTTVVTS